GRLRQRPIESGDAGRAVQALLLYIADDSDNLPIFVWEERELQMAADGTLIRPELLRHTLADDDYSGRVSRVVRADIAPLQYRNVHRLQVSRCRHADRYFGLFRHCDNGVSLNSNRLIGTTGQRQIVNRSGRRYAGQ